MKKFFLVWMIFGILNHPLLGKEERKTICLNMIVKNESKVIRRSLGSVKRLIDYWVIVDTGSTDGTQEIIREFLKDIPGELHERKWVDFAHNRNEALSLAKEKGDFVLFIDADEEFVYAEHFSLPNLDKDGYHIVFDHSGSSYSRIQLINNHLNWNWVGVLHEYLKSENPNMNIGILEGVTNIYRAEGCRSQDPLKFKNDAKILEEALVKEPNNSRYVFYLAQSYKDAQEYDKAIEVYQRRISMGGWDQEVFWSKYQVAFLKELTQADSQSIIHSYSEAYQFRPTRVEPLARLASFFRKEGNYLMGYLVASFGLTIPKTKDILFVESWAADYWLLFEQSICAYWIGKYEESLKGCEQLIKNPKVPEDIRKYVLDNQRWAQSKCVSSPVSIGL